MKKKRLSVSHRSNDSQDINKSIMSVQSVNTGQVRKCHGLRFSNLDMKASNSLFGNIYGDINTFL